jgi:hypothetical protein
MPTDFQLLRGGSLACCVVLAAAGLAMLSRRFVRRGVREVPWHPSAALLAGGVAVAAASLGASPSAARIALLGVVVAVASAAPSEARLPVPPRAAAVLVAAAFAIAALVLGLRLLDPALPLRLFFAWERAVLSGFELEMENAMPLSRSFLERLTWQRGLLSSGGDSLLYGFPTLVLLETAPASVLLFRLSAALLALASILLAWRVSRALFGAAAGAMTAWMWLLTPAFAAYFFYGTSMTAMWVAAWLALGAVHRLLTRPTASAAVLTTAALYLATLQYATGRAAAIGLLLASSGALLWPGEARGRYRAVAIVLAGVALLVFANVRSGTLEAFYAVRGENIVAMRAEEAAEHLGRTVGYAGRLTPADTVELAFALLRGTAPDFAWHVAPVNALAPLSARANSNDPPRAPLVLAPALPLVLWGLVLSCRTSGGSPRTGRVFAAAFLLTAVPLLLTNRLDLGRAAVLLPFLALWGGLGAADAGSRLARSVSGATAAGLGIAFGTGLLLQIHALGFDAALARGPLAEAFRVEVLAGPGPVRIVTREPEVDAAWLEALVRLRSRPDLLPALVHPQIVERLLDGPTHAQDAVTWVSRLSRDAALLLAPAEDFSALRREAEGVGLHPVVGGTAERHVLRYEGGVLQ